MQVITQPLGPAEANCYIVVDGARALLIDPGDDYVELKGILASLGAKLEAVLLTHAHFDHIGGLDKILQEFNVDVYMNPQEFSFLADQRLNGSSSFGLSFASSARPEPVKPGEQVIGGFHITAYFMPGHTCGSTVYQISNALFTGDVLFQGSIGRTDLPTGSMAEMKKTIAALKKMPGNLVVYPGHGPSTSLEQEQLYNPYFIYSF